MGSIIIIKNNDSTNDIHNFAMQSYENNQKNYYYSVDKTSNEECINKIKAELKKEKADELLLLLITYEQAKDKDSPTIKDMFIGNHVSINERNNIYYQMQIRYVSPMQDRTIQSIVDKIDLDLKTDFANHHYVMNSDMEVLYQELRERLEAKIGSSCEKKKIDILNSGIPQCSETYEMKPLAQKNNQAIRVYYEETFHKREKAEFQRDRERVVNSEAFRRLVDKAQIFSAEKGDYFRTRMTHTLEVNQIAKAIAFALGLNVDLTEAIALGHDLGHTPFGHQGERTLDDILSGKVDVGIVRPKGDEKSSADRCFGGFKHNYQSVKILTRIEEKDIGYKGLNVSVQVIEGVLKHTRLKPEDIDIDDFLPAEYRNLITWEEDEKQICSTLEGQTVAIADEIAQRGHDVDDALTSGVMSIDELMDRLNIRKCQDLHARIEQEMQETENVYLAYDMKKLKIAGIISCIVQYFVDDAIQNSQAAIDLFLDWNIGDTNIKMDNRRLFVDLSPNVKTVSEYLEKVVQKKVICNHEVARADYNASVVIKTLFKKYYENPRLLHTGTVRKIYVETLKHPNEAVAYSAVNIGDASVKLANDEIKEMAKEEFISSWEQIKEGTAPMEDIVRFEKRKILIRAIVDFIAGMTDGYALEEYEKIK